MRLSAYVNQNGVDPFNRGDFLFVGQHVGHSPNPLILVGGQALETWGLYFDVMAPTGDRHPLTEDADWLGSKQDALWLCERLGKEHTELVIAQDFDPTPNAAVAFLERPGRRVVMMDFLRTIVGPSNDEIKRLAVSVKVNDQVTLQVLHPLLCLESRMANLEVIASKRAGNGPMQAQWAVWIVAAFLRTNLGRLPPVELAKSCRAIAELAEFKNGRFCWCHFQIDPLAAVSDDVVQAVGGRFASDEWPRTVTRIRKKQARWSELHNRLS